MANSLKQDNDGAAAAPSLYFETIAGVPLHYARSPVAPYGTIGKPRRAGPIKSSLLEALEAVVRDVTELCPWGAPSVIVTGGVTGDGHGRHGLGEAFDWDSSWWQSHQLVVRRDYVHNPVLYSALDCVLRCHFGVVLNAWYNKDHEDHWHCDLGHQPGWHQSRSNVLGLQAGLHYVWGHELAIDGVWGKRTASATQSVLRTLLADDLHAAWFTFLRATARRGFETAAAASAATVTVAAPR